MKEVFTEELNAYLGRPHRGDSMDGKSPLEVYTELTSAGGFVARQLTKAQMRICAFAAEKITLRQDGRFQLHGHMYYSRETANLPKGTGYYARYNPHDLAEPVFVYRGSRIVAENVPQQLRGIGNDKATAEKVMKARAASIKADKAAVKAINELQRLDTPAEIAKRITATYPELIDKETGEIKREHPPEKLPVGKVSRLVPLAAEMPKEPSPVEVEETARVKALADDMARFDAEKNRAAMGRRGWM